MLPPFLPWNGACPCCWWVSFGHEDKDKWKNGRATRKGEPGSSQAQGAERPGVPDDPKLGKAVTQALIAELRTCVKKERELRHPQFPPWPSDASEWSPEKKRAAFKVLTCFAPNISSLNAQNEDKQEAILRSPPANTIRTPDLFMFTDHLPLTLQLFLVKQNKLYSRML